MTWVLAPLLLGGASTLGATLVRAVARATAAEDPAPAARGTPAGAGIPWTVDAPGEARTRRRDPQGRTPMEPPAREADVRTP